MLLEQGGEGERRQIRIILPRQVDHQAVPLFQDQLDEFPAIPRSHVKRVIRFPDGLLVFGLTDQDDVIAQLGQAGGVTVDGVEHKRDSVGVAFLRHDHERVRFPRALVAQHGDAQALGAVGRAGPG